MFAVPGWSLSADKLKSEQTAAQAAAAAAAAADAAAAPPPLPTYGGATGANSAQPKKRKRPSAAPVETGPKVTADNVVDLWERVIEKKKAKKEKKEKKEKAKKTESTESTESTETATMEKQQQSDKPQSDKTEPKTKPKTETLIEKTAPPPPRETDEDAPKPTKRQKKQQQQQQQQQPPREAPKDEKRPPKLESKKAKGPAVTEPRAGPAAPAATPEKASGGKKDKAKKGKDDKSQKQDKGKAEDKATPPAPATALALALPPPPPALTPLQAAMRAKLVSARFRHLNETLYTSPSAEALRLFADAPDMFQAYHEGFRQQVAVWPENPVDGYIAEVRRRGALGGSGGGGGGRGGRGGRGRGGRGGRGGFGGGGRPHPGDLPRTHGTCRIADIGCGDARLAAALAPDAARLRVAVLSYDLHADPRTTPHITAAADAADLPLAADSVDVAVFCLALMGTNWLAFVEEAYRVLRWKGELWVAEIKSRFAGAAELRARQKQLLRGGGGGGRGAGQPVAHSVGFRRKTGGKPGKPTGKGGKGKPEDDDDPDVVAAALAEVDGDNEGGSGGGTTDVAAFVHALHRRGFVLDEASPEQPAAGKPAAVDFSNKMFVKMRFVKAAAATVGKPEVLQALEAMGGAAAKKKPLKFIDGEGADRQADPMADPALEAKILKPCVYKLR